MSSPIVFTVIQPNLPIQFITGQGPYHHVTLALPSNDSFGLNQNQRNTPAAPEFRQSTPEQAIRRGQDRAFSCSLESTKLKSKRCILDSNPLLTTAQQANESK
jgi:hypothetical protein